MKIYEIRDITDDEAYYTKKYCLTAEEAITELKKVKEDISESPEDGDCVIGAVFSHEIGVWDNQKGFSIKIFEMVFTNKYDDDKDEYFWKSEITVGMETP